MISQCLTKAAETESAFDPNADRLREECGVFGIFGHADAAALTALGLHALQHRGQEAAGIVSFDGRRFHTERRLGLVGDAFSEAAVIEKLKGVEVLVLNALFRTAHPTHLSIGEAVEAARRVGAKQTYFTHLTHETSHADLAASLPSGIAPAYDGLTVQVGPS